MCAPSRLVSAHAASMHLRVHHLYGLLRHYGGSGSRSGSIVHWSAIVASGHHWLRQRYHLRVKECVSPGLLFISLGMRCAMEPVVARGEALVRTGAFRARPSVSALGLEPTFRGASDARRTLLRKVTRRVGFTASSANVRERSGKSFS